IAEWLEKLGMSEYAQRFAENRIDFSVLRDLTDQDPKDLGVVLGDRRKLLRAIANIDDKSPGVAPEPVLSSARPNTAATAAAEATGERRYLTVMFCDLVGSTSISAQLDADERGALAPLFVLVTARPEFRPSWGVRSHHGTISLVPLDRYQV